MKHFLKTMNSPTVIAGLILMLLINTGCGDSNADKNTPENTEAKDTTIRQDTVKVDPENFNEPH